MVEPRSEQERLVVEMAEVWNKKEYSRLPDLIAESAVMVEPALIGRENIPGPDGEAHGVEGVEAWMQTVEDEWTDWEISIRNMASEENQVLIEAEIQEEYNPTGNDVTFSCMEIYEVEAGKIQGWRLYFDRLEVGEKMGLL